MNTTLLRILRPYRRQISSDLATLKRLGPVMLCGLVLEPYWVTFEYADQNDTYRLRALSGV